MSADGSTILGFTTSESRAVQWKNGEIEELPSLKEFDEAKVCSISADGSTIVGYSGSMFKSTATLWTKNDVFSIQSLLEESGVTLERIHLSRADKVSANGLLVIGSYSSPWHSGYYRAILPSKK
jgi:uncharacterized membrane protein